MNALELSSQYSTLALDLAQMLQTVWQFSAFVTLGAIGWGLSVGQHQRPPSVTARLLVAFGLSVFYALNIVVLWNLLERFHSAQSIARLYAQTALSQPTPELDVIFQPLPDYLLIGTGAIGATVVLIVFILMGPMGRRSPGAARALAGAEISAQS